MSIYIGDIEGGIFNAIAYFVAGTPMLMEG